MKRLAFLVTVAYGVGLTARAHAQDKARGCIENYETAQVARKQRQLDQARAAAIACAAPECPTALARECAGWIGEIEQTQPSVVIVAVSAGHEVTDVHVWIDDKLVTQQLNGNAIAVDPGRRRFVFERGTQKRQVELVIREGEKNRKLEVDLGAGVRRMPLAGWVFGGVALAAGGAGAYFEWQGHKARNALDDAGCAPRCDGKQVDHMLKQFQRGDILLVGAGVSAVAALVLYFTAPVPAPIPRLSLNATTVPGGGAFWLQGTF
ncbi:MAG: hypothetical protein SF187_22960 [Deltaproteobacteria bacterium]|nr:hypothetical protein [Deltaproteobacteria bacterium]